MGQAEKNCKGGFMEDSHHYHSMKLHETFDRGTGNPEDNLSL